MDIYNKTVLPNGVKILSEFVPHLKSFSLGFWLNTGSMNETKSTNGISHFIEHMLFKGTKNRSAKRIADDIESLGGYLNAFTSKEHTCYYGRGLTNHFDNTFEVLSDMILNPLFKKQDISKESSVVVDELYDIEDNPEELIFDKFETELYKGHSLSLPVIGTEENIKSFTSEDLFGYTNKFYNASNLIISVSGAVDHNKVVEMAQKYLSGIPKGKTTRNKVFNEKPVKNIIIEKEIQQCHLVMGSATYGITSGHRSEVSILSHILGEGSSSRLFQSLREKNGITYQINTFFNSFCDVSSFGVYLSTNEKQFNRALDIVNKEFEDIKTRLVSKKELIRAKEYLIGNVLMSLENTTNRQSRMAQSEIYFNRIRQVDETLTEINKVTSEDVMAIAREILTEEKLLQVIMKPGKSEQ